MQLVRGLHNLKSEHRNCVVTIGNFDGVHQGHQALLRLLAAKAGENNTPTCLLSFDPLPHEYFSASKPAPRLTSARERYTTIVELDESLRPDMLLILRFDESLAQLTAEEFVSQVLVDALAVKAVVIGDDFRFARRREGTLAELERAGRALDYTTEQVPSVMVGGIRVSSTAIREALAAGDVARANTLLGRPYRMSGRIVRGRRVGRSLGYATANVDLRRRQSAVLGIYAVRVHGLPEGPVDGVASIGTRPTFDLCRPLLEVHLFDFARDIYGEYIHVDFIEHLRDEVKFASVEELVAQMRVDEENARSALANSSA